jgi:hypothetical protein
MAVADLGKSMSEKADFVRYPVLCLLFSPSDLATANASTGLRVSTILSMFKIAARASTNANSDSARASNPHMTFFTR